MVFVIYVDGHDYCDSDSTRSNRELKFFVAERLAGHRPINTIHQSAIFIWETCVCVNIVYIFSAVLNCWYVTITCKILYYYSNKLNCKKLTTNICTELTYTYVCTNVYIIINSKYDKSGVTSTKKTIYIT